MVSIASDDVKSMEPPDADADAAAAAAAAATATDAPIPAGIPNDAFPPSLPITSVVESVIASGFATTNTVSSGPLSTLSTLSTLSAQATEAANDASPDSHMQIPGPYAGSL